MRLFFLYLMVGVGTGLVTAWTGNDLKVQSQMMTNWYYGIEAAVEAFLLAVIATRIPTKAAQLVDHTVSSTLGDIILASTVASAIRDGVKAIPKAVELTGKLGGQAFNGMVNLADAGATKAMGLWDRRRTEQTKPPAPPTKEELSQQKTAPLWPGSGPGPSLQGPNLPAPSPNGAGGGTAGGQPRRPGSYTRGVAIDVTELQNPKDKN